MKRKALISSLKLNYFCYYWVKVKTEIILRKNVGRAFSALERSQQAKLISSLTWKKRWLKKKRHFSLFESINRILLVWKEHGMFFYYFFPHTCILIRVSPTSTSSSSPLLLPGSAACLSLENRFLGDNEMVRLTKTHNRIGQNRRKKAQEKAQESETHLFTHSWTPYTH